MALLKRGWLILLVSVLGASIMFCYTRYLVTPLYRSTVSFYVNNGQKNEDKISNSDITASQSLVETYIVILKYGTTLDDVIKDAGLNCSLSELTKQISCKSINDTEVFQVTVTDPNPETAARIAASIAKFLPEKVSDVIEGSTVRVVRNASVPSAPSSPNLRHNLLIGAAAGFMLGCLYVALRHILDDRIRDASRLLKDNYEHPVLAVIPDLRGSSKGYYYNSQAKEN
jgi:capsular polysaccharide biosynthesis protein